MNLDKLKKDVFDAVNRFEKKSGLVVSTITTKHDSTLEMQGNHAQEKKRLISIQIGVELI